MTEENKKPDARRLLELWMIEKEEEEQYPYECDGECWNCIYEDVCNQDGDENEFT